MKQLDQTVLQKISEGAREALPEQLEWLKRFCSIDCPSNDEAGNAQVVAVVDEALRTIDGIEIEHVYAPGDGIHVLGRLRPERPTGKIILNAHLDTVFQKVSCADHPFHIEGDRAYGLGVGDCKGGVAVSIAAVRLAQRLGVLPQKEIVLMFNCDEELSPTESGYRFFDRELPADEAYVFEGTGEDRNICTGRKCSCSFAIDVTGRRAHSGNAYLKGRSAAVELAHRILRLYESNLDDRGIQFNIGKLTNDDPNNVVSGHCRATGSVRAASRADVQTILDIAARVEAEPPYVEGTQTKITVSTAKAPLIMERTERNLALYGKVRDVGRLLGWELPEKTRGGFGDVCYFSSKGCTAVDGLGPWSMNGHSSDEYIVIPSLTERTALFAAVLGAME